ncbi:stage V sporulation protein AD [Oscillospiraceae bacterium OttesenSCG-928-G22]|nr:stage V sporulation protein AD [Oscillospiraceae bacterium OttesenSCG-928-G22]
MISTQSPGKRLGERTVRFSHPPAVAGFASIAGKRESEGPLKGTFDITVDDNSFGESSWEKSESRIQKELLTLILQKTGLAPTEIQYVFGGDLINQCISTTFGLRESNLPIYGIYSACATMAEGISLASAMVDGGFAKNVLTLTSSHFCSAERQYRLPLEYGGQRTPTSQWTVTGGGAAILSSEGDGPYVTHMTTGKIIDYGIKDASNMGGAMAPAALDTIETFFADTGLTPNDFDLVLTGDLGHVGLDILRELLKRDGLNFNDNLADCGVLIFDRDKQDVHAGGSGAACSATVLCGKILNDMAEGRLHRVLFAGTGALLSTVSTQQGESIPCICHAVAISNRREG